MNRDEILAEARGNGDGSIDAVIEIARRDERARIIAYLRKEAATYEFGRAGGAINEAADTIESGEW